MNQNWLDILIEVPSSSLLLLIYRCDDNYILIKDILQVINSINSAFEWITIIMNNRHIIGLAAKYDPPCIGVVYI